MTRLFIQFVQHRQTCSALDLWVLGSNPVLIYNLPLLTHCPFYTVKNKKAHDLI